MSFVLNCKLFCAFEEIKVKESSQIISEPKNPMRVLKETSPMHDRKNPTKVEESLGLVIKPENPIVLQWRSSKESKWTSKHSDFVSLMASYKSSNHSTVIGVLSVYNGLGNQIRKYIMLWHLFRTYQMVPMLSEPNWNILAKYFHGMDIPKINLSQYQTEHLEEVTRTVNESVIFSGLVYVHRSYDALSLEKWPYTAEILNQLQFKPEYLEFADKLLLDYRNDFKENEGVQGDITFIGVHVRRTDYLNYLKKCGLKGAKTVDSNFFFQAMTKMEEKFSNCLFVFVSDDEPWIQKHFASKPNAVVHNRRMSKNFRIGLDLALLSRCNHSIYDYGSFGQFGAFMAGGYTIFAPVRSSCAAGYI